MGRAFESRPAHHVNRFSMATPASSAREIFRTTKSGKICEAAALAFIVTLGSGLRFWHLGARSLWVDEGATAVIARLDGWNFLRLLWRREANMSFYYLLMRGWIHLGHGEAWLRALSATFGVLANAVTVLKLAKLNQEAQGEFSRAGRAILVVLIPAAGFLAATGAGPLAWLPRPGWRDVHHFAIYLSGAGGDVLLGLYLLALL